MKICKYILKDKNTTFIDEETVIGENVIIYENNRIENGTIIEDNVTIYPNCFIDKSVIKKGAKIYNSIIVNSEVGERSSVGPFSYLRSKTKLGANVKVGSYSEIKDSVICSYSKISNFCNISNTEIGESCKIGSFVCFTGLVSKSKCKSKVGDNSVIENGVQFNSVVDIKQNSRIAPKFQLDESWNLGAENVGLKLNTFNFRPTF